MNIYTHIGHSRGSRDGWANGAQVQLGWHSQHQFIYVHIRVDIYIYVYICSRYIHIHIHMYTHEKIYTHRAFARIARRLSKWCASMTRMTMAVSICMSSVSCMGSSSPCPMQVCRVWEYICMCDMHLFPWSLPSCTGSSSSYPTQVCRVWKYICIHVLCFSFREFGLMYGELVSLPYAGV